MKYFLLSILTALGARFKHDRDAHHRELERLRRRVRELREELAKYRDKDEPGDQS